MTPIRVLIVDDHRLLTQGLELLLRGEDGVLVVGTVPTGEDALRFFRSSAADVALVDIDLPGMDGIALTARLKKTQPELRVVIITAYQQADVLTRALEAGAYGYVLKTDVADTLADSIRLAMAGSMVLPAEKMASALSPPTPPTRTNRSVPRPSDSSLAIGSPVGPLSDREVEILQAIAEGKSTVEMAEAFAVGESTIRTHVERIFNKLDVHSRAEAVWKGLHLGLLATDPSEQSGTRSRS